jgi:hypothetical protein
MDFTLDGNAIAQRGGNQFLSPEHGGLAWIQERSVVDEVQLEQTFL